MWPPPEAAHTPNDKKWGEAIQDTARKHHGLDNGQHSPWSQRLCTPTRKNTLQDQPTRQHDAQHAGNRNTHSITCVQETKGIWWARRSSRPKGDETTTQQDGHGPRERRRDDYVSEKDGTSIYNIPEAKRRGKIKGRGCSDGRKKREYLTKDDTSAPTVATE